jgi:hypothetical protein
MSILARKGYTQNAWQGDKYESTKDLSTVEKAKLIRKEIRDKYPSKKGWKISVRSQYFSMGSSIDVFIEDMPFDPFNPKWKPNNYENHEHIYNEETEVILKDLESIGNQYNYSDCDGMIDYFNVDFYYHVQIAYSLRKKYRKDL